ncbi:unnamed protein product [Rotaria sp. Silwood1]|nr:unnamed protein product [Rotaria sp. Silwood1]CAF1059432.1 unnamed protein product [Rotaria sp. Silwood1]CAF4676722.1 unnamed protein product [Rotaria sp. Silwood1]
MTTWFLYMSLFLGEVGSPNFFDSSNTDTKSGIYPSQSNSNGSPPQATPYLPNLFVDLRERNIAKDEKIDFSLMTHPSEKLRIIAQPKAFYRERYCSETDPSKHRAQRFIRADDDIGKHEYPTVQIPLKWRDLNRDSYIRVTLVTIFSEKVPVICIHPYIIDTPENHVLRDSHHNSLYFPITKDDVLSGHKSFRINRKKMVQHDLKSYGPLHLFDLNQDDIQRVANSHDAKQIIETYQLWKSQLVFTVAERLSNNNLPIPIPSTSVTSQIMCDEASRREKEPSNNHIDCITMLDDDTVRCTPKKGDWNGGDEILMTIPRLDKRKIFNIYFDYGSMGRLGDIKVTFVDSKTIFFQTPPCQMLIAEQNFTVPIIVTQNDLVIARIDFIYLTPMKTTINLCSRCQWDMINNNHINNKKRYYIFDPTESDGGELLAQQMSRLTTEEKYTESNRRIIDDDKTSKFDKYLGQLQDAIVEFVRTNNPSRLFRRTRLLLAKCDQNPPPLDDAIQRGHIDLALKLIEQVVDMSTSPGLLERKNDDGETPLLLAAKLNQWVLIEAILKKRLDLAENTDKNDNNILHLLANISENKANETIKNVLLLLSNDIKTNLLKKKNKDNRTPIEIAQSQNNTYCSDLFKKT